MNWIARALVGPTLWAVAFIVIYALHGVGCAQGWPAVRMPLGSLHQVVLVGAFVSALLVSGGALLWLPRGDGAKALVIGVGGWIGFGGILLTLFPVLVVSSCQA